HRGNSRAGARTGCDDCRQQRRRVDGYGARDGRPDGPPAMTTSAHHFAATRSVARKLALQALYRWQLNEGPWQDLVLEFGDAEDMPRADRAYFRQLVEGVWGAREALDTRLAEIMDRPPVQLDPVEHAAL